MAATHALAGGMGGIRTAGDLVARMMYGKSMKLGKAKDYVARKLGVTAMDLVDENVMRNLREELGIGTITSVPGTPKGMPAKLNIEKLLDITINSCEHYRMLCNRWFLTIFPSVLRHRPLILYMGTDRTIV